MMQFYSLNKQAKPVDFRTAAITGQAPDGGLYYPEKIPSSKELLALATRESWSKETLAFEIMKPYCEGSLSDEQLFSIVSQTIQFPFPLVQVNDHIYTLELFHGPTLAFKDVGARFMSRCLGHFNKDNNRKVTVLVATSGDTGGAVANGFEGIEGVEVVILYPEGKVSPVQELQLTTCGNNVHALKVAGSFDDCQAIVKAAFRDEELNQQYQLTSANSINVARWLPQQLYYFFALQQWPHTQPPVICVPSGNFGNICAGMIAQRSGLNVQLFIAACNANDVIPRYLQNGILDERPTLATYSNAMDVAKPSNFVRILEMYHNDLNVLRPHLIAVRVDDETTLHTLAHCYNEYGYLADPHGAVALYALEQYLMRHPDQQGIFLETAHPVKFPEVMQLATGKPVDIPPSVQHLFTKEKRSTTMDASFQSFKEWMRYRN
jgi:threonine synthase